MYVAYDHAESKTSASVHGPLRARLADDQQLAETMREIADLVTPAVEALRQGDAETLHRLINRNFDLRQSLYPIRPAHLDMITTARDAGASAKFAGSGGAIIGTCRDQAMFLDLEARLLRKNPHWRIVRPAVCGIGPSFEAR
jgi:glucuronokinase